MAFNSTASYGGVTDFYDVEYLCEPSSTFQTITGVFCILIFIFSVTSNCLLLCVLAVYEKMKQNVTNLFILNLACSDLIFTVTLPFWAVDYLHHWVFGEYACKFMTMFYAVGLYSSVILLTAVTVDRFITVVLDNRLSNPVKRQRCAMFACASAWVISIAASVSDTINVQVEEYWEDFFICVDPSEEHDVKLGYYLQVSLLFFLPFAIIVSCYSAVLKTVLQASNRKRYRTVVVVLCIVAAFFICWGPFNILLFIMSFYEPESCDAQKRLHIVLYICRILAFSHCCVNPVLYMLSPQLRGHLNNLLRCRKARRRNRERGAGQSISVNNNVAFTVQNSAVLLDLH